MRPLQKEVEDNRRNIRYEAVTVSASEIWSCRCTVRLKSRDFSKSTTDSNGRRLAGLLSDSHRLPPCGRMFETQVPGSRSSSSILPNA
jgi:hypothetical protein